MKKIIILILFLSISAISFATENEVKQEVSLLIQANLSEGKALYEQGNYKKAKEKFESVLLYDENNKEAQDYLELCQYYLALRSSEEMGITEIDREKAEQLYKQGKTLFKAGDFEGALQKFEDAVRINPRHIPAQRAIINVKKVQSRLLRYKKMLSEDKFIKDVDKTWLVQDLEKKASARKKFGKPKVKSRRLIEMEKKVQVIIDEINFTQASIRDVIKYLAKVSGVNIIVDEGIFEPVQTTTFTNEIAVNEEEPQTHVLTQDTDKVTISLKNIPLINALEYILRTKGLKYRIDEYAILVSTPERLAKQEMETRYYKLSSGVGSFHNIKTQNSSLEETFSKPTPHPYYDDEEDTLPLGMPTKKQEDSKEELSIEQIFKKAGIPFPPGSSVFLDKRTATLVVRNTPDNLALVEELLEKIDVTPFQVEIETRFIEVSQGDLTELGFEWMLKTPLSVSKTNAGDNKIVIDNQNYDDDYGKYPAFSNNSDYPYNYGLTKGLRFVEDDSGKSLGNILSLSGVLTDPEFRIVMHALDQSGRANELSAPKVTTLNNQAAQIEVVEELRYPTEYDVTPPTVNDAGSIITPPVVTPSSFTLRKVGIILNVTPTVGRNKEKINLVINPEVSELVSWVDYGDVYPTGSGDSYKIRILQPVFKTKNVTTNVVLNNGDTIVLGGLISEESQKIHDRVPVLSSIPILGKLFRNDSENTVKTNLLIFVTARLLSPSGERI